MKEKMPLVTSDDYGKDEASAKALLSRHNRLEGEIKAFGSEIKRLDELAQLMTKAASEHNVSSPQSDYAPPSTCHISLNVNLKGVCVGMTQFLLNKISPEPVDKFLPNLHGIY